MRLRHEGSRSSKSAQHLLDYVIWRALTSVHERLAEGNERARRYPAAVAPFAATADHAPASLRSLLDLIGPDDRIAMFTTAEVEPPPAFSVIRRASVEQMILADASACAAPAAAPIEALGTADVPEMLALTSTTQPGPFGPRTIELGGYVGVRQQGMLVAMAGERMRLDGFTEISAVCVDAAYRGQGFAADLVRSLATSIAARSELPFLHVFSVNHAAITLYRKLGFALRRQMHLTVLGRAEGGPDPSYRQSTRK